jgi:hypothetical protein
VSPLPVREGPIVKAVSPLEQALKEMGIHLKPFKPDVSRGFMRGDYRELHNGQGPLWLTLEGDRCSVVVNTSSDAKHPLLLVSKDDVIFVDPAFVKGHPQYKTLPKLLKMVEESRAANSSVRIRSGAQPGAELR